METNIDPHLQEDESTTGPIKELIEIWVDPNEPSRVVKIDKGQKKELAQQLVEFLSLNQDAFAWTHADMAGIQLEVMCHQLNIDQQAKLVHQKRRALDADRYKALQDEVDRLLKIRFIRESYCPNWLVNPVLVIKPNGKWMTCIDFTNLNKACPKDIFPLPRIDQLVNATARHELLSFMDMYSAMKSVRACPFNTVWGWKFTSKFLNSTTHLRSLPEAYDFCST